MKGRSLILRFRHGYVTQDNRNAYRDKTIVPNYCQFLEKGGQKLNAKVGIGTGCTIDRYVPRGYVNDDDDTRK